MIKNLLIAFGVTFVLALGFGFINGITAQSSGVVTTVLPMTFGILTFLGLQMRAGTRKEAPVDDAVRRAAVGGVAPPGQALLYVYREGFVGKLVGWDVSLDGSALAQLRSPRFTQAVVSPGAHTLKVSLGGLAGSQVKPAETTFEAQSGEVIVFAMKAKNNVFSGELSFVREADGRAALQKFAGIRMVAAERPNSVVAA